MVFALGNDQAVSWDACVRGAEGKTNTNHLRLFGDSVVDWKLKHGSSLHRCFLRTEIDFVDNAFDVEKATRETQSGHKS